MKPTMKRQCTNERMLRAKSERQNKKRIAPIVQIALKAMDWMMARRPSDGSALNSRYASAFMYPSPPPFTPEQERAAVALRARHIAEDWSTERYCLELQAIRETVPAAAPGTDADQLPKPFAG